MPVALRPGRILFALTLAATPAAWPGSASARQDPAFPNNLPPGAQAPVPPPPPVPATTATPPPGQAPALNATPAPIPGQAPAPAPTVAPGDVPPGAEVLTRGPIHEAFATPVVFNPAAPFVAPKPPPAAIEEVPPAQKPEGADVEWIPGYWAWDDDRNDYIWVSGVWRDIPPGRQWIPGYWSQVDGGYAWTAGFWAVAQADGPLDYLPAPPASLENGPNVPAPGDNYAWAPGSWVWQVDRYAWQPGYWYQTQQDWIWSPASYQSTPSGYVYNPGYWDYSLAQRGLPFAPLGFGNGGLPGGPLSYTPSYVLPAAGLLASLFVRPNYGHYYYGDYYGAASAGANAAYVPWFGFRNNKLGYDPIYSSLAAQNARQPNWDQRYRDDFRYRVDHREARPLPTFAAQRAFIDQRRARGEDIRNLGLVEPLKQWAANPNGGRPLVAVNQDQRQGLIQRQAELARFRDLRLQQEAQGRQAAAARNLRAQEARQPLFRNELPRSPIAAANNPRFESRGLGNPPGFPAGHDNFRPNFGPNRPDVPFIGNRGPEGNRPGPGPGQERQREALQQQRQAQQGALEQQRAAQEQQRQAIQRVQEQQREAQPKQQERPREAQPKKQDKPREERGRPR